MIRVTALLFAVVPLQDPDRSTPEKAFQGFVEVWDGAAPKQWAFQMIMDLDALGRFARTEEFQSKKGKELAEFRKWLEELTPISSKYEIAGRSEGKDGRVTIDSIRKVRVKKRSYENEKETVKEVDQALPHRHVFRKVGDAWLIDAYFTSCPPCEGSGLCSMCKGTGTFQGRECRQKTCSTCNGEKLRPEEFTKRGLELVIPDGELKYSTDLSSPKTAAQAILDLSIRTAVEYGVSVRAFMELVRKTFRLFIVPETVKKLDDLFAEATEAGKKRYKEDKPRIDSVEEKDGRVYVVLVTKGNWGRVIMGEDDKVEHRTRFVLKKVGEKWLIDAEQHACWTCRERPGQCTVCKGTGKFRDADCYACKGAKKCTLCKGEGWSGN